MGEKPAHLTQIAIHAMLQAYAMSIGNASADARQFMEEAKAYFISNSEDTSQ